MELGVLVDEVGRQDLVDDFGLDAFDDLLLGDVVAVLGADHDGLDASDLVAVVLEGDLALAVGPEEVEDLGLAGFGESARELVGVGNGGGHELGGFVAGEAEHEALVTSALVLVGGLVDAPGDVGRLLLDGGEHGAGFPVESHAGALVADLPDGLAHDLGHVDPGGGRDLASHDDHSGLGEGLAGHARGAVLLEDVVEDGVGDLVADLVGMAFGDGLGCEVSVRHGVPVD